jgi:hypothetical protein
MMGLLKNRNEFESSVDTTADRIAYLVLAYGLLAIVAFRGLVDREQSWDLLALVIVGGLVGTAFRVGRGRTTARSVGLAIATVLVAAVLAGAIALMRA